ncbi:hypothetical protein HUJ04_009115 [Dendroctonus ponderosae]|nr:hypothetical protein HUJ04_009115 [Dendroctonus ponderosae]
MRILFRICIGFRHRNAKQVGIDLLAGPAYGLLVHVTSKHDQADHFGCIYPYDSSRSDGKLPHSGTPWIALIKRGKCNFDVKVDNAFKSGAGGVLIYNDRMAPTLDKMKLTNDPRRRDPLKKIAD